jgi:hypothetical protein
MPKRPDAAGAEKPKRENILQRAEDVLESRFLAAAELATTTTSAEENLASALVEAIEGHRDQDLPASAGKPKSKKPKRSSRKSKR